MTSTQIEASRIGVDMRLTVANLAPDARRVWAVPGVIEAMNEAIARAILAATEAERERCARIAKNKYTTESVNKNKKGEPFAASRIAIYVASNIAAAIRKATP